MFHEKGVKYSRGTACYINSELATGYLSVSQLKLVSFGFLLYYPFKQNIFSDMPNASVI